MSIRGLDAFAFYAEALEAGAVWGVEDDAGLPVVPVDDRRVVPFWTSESRVQHIVATVPEYAQFEIFRVSLDLWRAEWLPGMTKDGVNVGVNWSGNPPLGLDVAPADVETSLTTAEAGGGGA